MRGHKRNCRCCRSAACSLLLLLLLSCWLPAATPASPPSFSAAAAHLLASALSLCLFLLFSSLWPVFSLFLSLPSVASPLVAAARAAGAVASLVPASPKGPLIGVAPLLLPAVPPPSFCCLSFAAVDLAVVAFLGQGSGMKGTSTRQKSKQARGYRRKSEKSVRGSHFPAPLSAAPCTLGAGRTKKQRAPQARSARRKT